MATQAYGFDPKFDWSKLEQGDGSSDEFDPGGDINEIATLQKGGGNGLPAWLNPNPNALTRELRQTFRKIPGMFDTGDLEKTYNDQIATIGGLGGQIATNAAREAIARAGQTGGQVNSEMAKAQAMLPVYSETGKLATDKAQAMMDAAKAQASIQSEVASTLGQLRTSYLANLAQIHMQKKTMKNANLNNAAELALRKYQGDQSNTLQLEELAQRGSQFDRTHDLERTKLGIQTAEDLKKMGGMYFTDPRGEFTGGDRAFFEATTRLGRTLPQLLG